MNSDQFEDTMRHAMLMSMYAIRCLHFRTLISEIIANFLAKAPQYNLFNPAITLGN